MPKIEYVIFDFDGVLLDSYNKKYSVKLFLSRYVGQTVSQPLVSGMDSVIKKLSDTHDLGIVSSTRAETIRTFLEKHGLTGFFADIAGDDVTQSKADKIDQILLEHGITPEQCLFITDTTGDIKEAHIAGVPVAAVSWGYHGPAELIKAEPDVIFDKPAEILAWLSNLEREK